MFRAQRTISGTRMFVDSRSGWRPWPSRWLIVRTISTWRNSRRLWNTTKLVTSHRWKPTRKSHSPHLVSPRGQTSWLVCQGCLAQKVQLSFRTGKLASKAAWLASDGVRFSDMFCADVVVSCQCSVIVITTLSLRVCSILTLAPMGSYSG